MRPLLFALAAIAIFTVFTTVYAATAESGRVRNLPKWVWVLMCLFIPVIGGMLYITIGRPVVQGTGASGVAWAGSQWSSPRRAPDDDPDFLRDLEKKIKPQDPKDEDPTDK
ncbi:MAG: PLD nuclease N-terminal domain-containing protein [Micrococcales bacterium]